MAKPKIPKLALWLAFGWTRLIAVSLYVNLGEIREATIKAAQVTARASIDKDIVYRLWNARHGGVYVPISEIGIPNPYLDIPDRDLHHLAHHDPLTQPPNRLRFEDALQKLLAHLRKLGVSVALDDFGTGYSSLSYLKPLPLSALKTDQSFVREIPRLAADKAVVKTIISLAKNLDLLVIAEGVEEASQRDYLAAHGCDLLQGYLFRPTDPEGISREFFS